MGRLGSYIRFNEPALDPGHAYIVVDMAVHETSGKKVFLLAQSYMQAQEIQILQILNKNELSPRYITEFDTTLITPEWTFKKSDLKRFTY